MFRIRRIYDDISPVNKESLKQVKEILGSRFTDVSPDEIESLGEKLRNPFKQRFRTILFVAESMRRKVLGFASLLHEPEIGFVYLDWIATAGGKTGGGLGGALYDTVRREAAGVEVSGLFFECLPDEPNDCEDPALIKENQARLRFYERYGAHGHPSFTYPYFSGFADECGEGEGEGFNMNIPLPQQTNGKTYQRALKRAVERIQAFDPDFLIVSLGLDPAKDDPTGTWTLVTSDFEENGRIIGLMGLPTVVIQEGGYRIRTLGKNAVAFFTGLAATAGHWSDRLRVSKPLSMAIDFRETLTDADPERVRRLVEVTGFFSEEEVEMAKELVVERLAKGAESGYHFLLAEHHGRLIGYACYGPIPCTTGSYDLYWIAVHPDYHRRGVGRRLIEDTEGHIRTAGGGRIYVDTSQRAQYASTRAFYESCGYRLESILKDFYGPGDGKVIYCKEMV